MLAYIAFVVELDFATGTYTLDGVSVAVCAVRGGGEKGPAWHAAGKLERKSASADDVVACARRRRDGVAPSLKPGAAGRSSGAA